MFAVGNKPVTFWAVPYKPVTFPRLGIVTFPRLGNIFAVRYHIIVQELCQNRGGRPGLSVLTSLLASVDVKLY